MTHSIKRIFGSVIEQRATIAGNLKKFQSNKVSFQALDGFFEGRRADLNIGPGVGQGGE